MLDFLIYLIGFPICEKISKIFQFYICKEKILIIQRDSKCFFMMLNMKKEIK